MKFLRSQDQLCLTLYRVAQMKIRKIPAASSLLAGESSIFWKWHCLRKIALESKRCTVLTEIMHSIMQVCAVESMALLYAIIILCTNTYLFVVFFCTSAKIIDRKAQFHFSLPTYSIHQFQSQLFFSVIVHTSLSEHSKIYIYLPEKENSSLWFFSTACRPIPGVPPRAERSIFITLIFEK